MDITECCFGQVVIKCDLEIEATQPPGHPIRSSRHGEVQQAF